MLVEMYSPVFREKGETRKPIKFNVGLNVIQGEKNAANSIGKSSALLAIDFVFGGETYINSDGVKHLGNHTIYFCFEFDKKYYYGRNTGSPDEIVICNSDYSETTDKISKDEFTAFLKNKYLAIKTNMSFRQLISTYLRVYGKSNQEEDFPLQGYRNQSQAESIKILMSLLDYYKDVEPFTERWELEKKKLSVYKDARKYSFISNLVGGKKKYEENLTRIDELKAELSSLTESSPQPATLEDIEQSKYIESLKSSKLVYEEQLEKLKRRAQLLSISIEYGLAPTEADLSSLAEYFPGVAIKKLYEVENYHKKLATILSSEFQNEKEQIDEKINECSKVIEEITTELSKHKVKNQFSREFLKRHSELNGEIKALQNQNNAFIEENTLKESRDKAKVLLDKNIEQILADMNLSLNNKMREFNDRLYEIKRNAPVINIIASNSYTFFTPNDTGTGTNFKGLILLDLALIYLSYLPVLAHDSLLFKNVDDEGVNGIMRIYNNVKDLKKQVFIAFDKQSSYSDETYEILQNNCVLQLGSDGYELYGKSWNREVANETQL